MENKTYALGERIRELRKNAHLKQRQLADLLEISHSSMSQYESGARAPYDELKIKIADIFNVSIDYLIGHNTKENVTFKNLSEKQLSLLKVSEKLSENDFEKVLEYAQLLSGKYMKNI